MLVGLSKKMTAVSGQVVSSRAYLLGFLLGTDGINDPRFSIHNGVDNTGQEKIPSTTYDASALGPNGAMFSFRTPCSDGIYFNHESGSNYECIVYYQEY